MLVCQAGYRPFSVLCHYGRVWLARSWLCATVPLDGGTALRLFLELPFRKNPLLTFSPAGWQSAMRCSLPAAEAAFVLFLYAACKPKAKPIQCQPWLGGANRLQTNRLASKCSFSACKQGQRRTAQGFGSGLASANASGIATGFEIWQHVRKGRDNEQNTDDDAAG